VSVLIRAATYSSLFVGLVLVFLPARVLAVFGAARPAAIGPAEIIGMAMTAGGGLVAFWCVAVFAVIGQGTPAPFDPPRRLVVRGPYRLVRNPMYLGAALALAGAAIVYRSPALAGYLVVLAAASHSFVVFYEEPTLGRLFGADYAAYRAAVRRWLPRRPPHGGGPGWIP